LHGNGLYAAFFKPVGNRIEVFGENTELAYRSEQEPAGTATKWLVEPMSMPAACSLMRVSSLSLRATLMTRPEIDYFLPTEKRLPFTSEPPA
jgi:hypothetical protein